jgi:acyl-CoA synthetase (AMP-forming)/AMP-acid ligase II
MRSQVILPGYGLAEHVVFICDVPHGTLPKNHNDRVSCGVARFGVDLRIVDPETQAECPPEVEGEIWVHSACKALGYWNKPELSQSAFHGRIARYCHDDVSAAPADGYLRTGDRGYLLADGNLMVSGRIKDMIIVNGRKFWPTDIERTIQDAHEKVPRLLLSFSFTQCFSSLSNFDPGVSPPLLFRDLRQRGQSDW